MKDLRALLIDCRIELRKAIRDFEKSELCDRINAAITELAKAQAAPQIAAAQAKAAEGAEQVADEPAEPVTPQDDATTEQTEQ
jgi:hypothetical protein